MSENEITTQSLQEKEVDGKIYRIWNAAENLWHKLSFINKAIDTICDDGNNVETKLIDLNKSLDETKKSVADGKKLVATSISDQGVATASDATFQIIADNIGDVGSNKYNSGRTQGRSDVTSSPNTYNLYTKSQYDANYNAGVSAGGGIKEQQVITGNNGTGSNWGKAISSCTKYCSAGTWIVGVTTTGDSPSSEYTSCSPVTQTYISASGKYAAGGVYRVELSSPQNITAQGIAESNADWDSNTTAKAVFIKVK